MKMSHSGSGETGTTGSLEISVPTDLTVTSEMEYEDRRPPKHVREMHDLASEKARIQMVTEKLRLEIKSKESELVSCKAQFSANINHINIQNDMKLSEKQAVINRLEAELMAVTDELRLLKERAAKELANLLQKCYQFQQNQERLIVKHDELKLSLTDLILPEEELERIRKIPRDQLSLQQFVMLRVYEMIIPLKTKVRDLEASKNSLESIVVSREKEIQLKNMEHDRLNEELNTLRGKVVEYSSKCEELRKDSRLDDFRVHNFDRIKRERDKYEGEREGLMRDKSEMEAANSLLKKEKSFLEERLADLNGKFRNHDQELNKYKTAYYDTKSQLDKINEDNQKTCSRLRLEQERSEEFHDKFLKARTEVLSLTGRLQDVDNEMKSLKERHLECSKSEKEVKEQLNDLQNQHRNLQNDTEALLLRRQKEKDLLKLEISELKGNYNSLLKTYNDSLDNNAKLLKDNQYHHSYNRDDNFYKEREISKLKQEISSLKQEIDQYKSVEKDYMSTLQVFASVTDKDKETPELCIPASSIIKGKYSEQTLSLTRKILYLERQNAEAFDTIKKLTVSLDQMRSKLYAFKSAIGMAGKPSEKLLEKIRSQEEQILVLEEALRYCNESKAILLEDKKNLEIDLKKASSYLESSMIHEEEIIYLKKRVEEVRNSILKNLKQNKSKIPNAIKITNGS